MISLTSPVRTRAHDWPAAAKLGALLIATLALAATQSPAVLALAFAGMAALYALPGRVFLSHGARRIRGLAPFVAVVLVWHLVTGDPATGLGIALRMITAVGLANLVTMTTRLSDIMQVIRRGGAPLARLGLNLRALEIGIALVIRMVPVLSDKGAQLTQSWSARSARKPRWRIVLPLTLATLDDADHVAEALRARGGTAPPIPRTSSSRSL